MPKTRIKKKFRAQVRKKSYLGFFIALLLLFLSIITHVYSEVIDNDEYLIIPEGETYTLHGIHSYIEYIEIRGTLNITPYISSDKTTGGIFLTAPEVRISTAGRINSDGRGYDRVEGPGAGMSNTSSGQEGSGAGYGGKGGDSHIRSGGYIYGSLEQPADLGSGGGNGEGSIGGRGGGKLKIIINGSLTNNGEIRAHGGDGAYKRGGGGSGGSIWIEAGEISGSGLISANGGSGGSKWAGGGAGGRIAIYYDANTYTGEITAYGRGGGYRSSYSGGCGTIYLKDRNQILGDLIIKNGGNSNRGTPLPSGNYNFKEVKTIERGNLIITDVVDVKIKDLKIKDSGGLSNDGNLLVSENLVLNSGGTLVHNAGSFTSGDTVIGNRCRFYLNTLFKTSNLTIEEDGLVTHYTGDEDFELIVENDLIINTGGKINADIRGYGRVEGPGAGMSNTGGYNRYGSGAGHGGYGGNSTENNPGGDIYGSLEQPIDMGSGGGNGEGSIGGRGGGKLKIVVSGRLINDGEIKACGESGTHRSHRGSGGGGTGGSIWIEAGEISGNGVISANGGDGGSVWAGGGAGGRIAIYYNANTYTGDITVYGKGGGYRPYGGAGTIYLKDNGEAYGDLIIKNEGNSNKGTPLIDGSYSFRKIEVVDRGRIIVSDEDEVTIEDLVVRSTGVLVNVGNIEINQDLALNSGGVIVHNAGNFTNGNMVIGNGGTYYLNTRFETLNLTIEEGGLVTHSSGDEDFELIVENDLVINAAGKINVDSTGYMENTGPGAGETGTELRYSGSGGGYGGKGGNSIFAIGGDIYGSLEQPIDFGSGGGHGEGRLAKGGRGGGKVKITVRDRLINNGAISAYGGDGGKDRGAGGGGSGGSIWIETGELSGSGLISANGGDGGTSRAGGGGGGRIAIYYDNDMFTGSITANGGIGCTSGREGTIMLETHESSPLVTAILEQTHISDNIFHETIEIENIDLTISSFDGPAIIVGVNFEEFEKIEIKTGPFAEKGFFKGELTINIGDETNTCYCKGAFYLKENKIYLNGALEGNGYGIIEGIINDDGTYTASINFTEIGNHVFTEGVSLQGIATSQQSTEYPSTQLYYLQTTVEGEISGYYSGTLNTTFTHLRVKDETNPYNNEGFAIISYNSEIGAGMGYGYGKKLSSSRVEFQGLFNTPLGGFMRARLDESVTPNVLSFSISRIDYGKPPEADFKVRIWGPENVSPGQRISYMIEARNDGMAEGSNYSVIVKLPKYSNFSSAAEGYKFYSIANWDKDDIYRPISVVRWDILDVISAKSSLTLSAQIKLFFKRYDQRVEAYILPKLKADTIFEEYGFEGNK